jgi:hypothetical protein
LAVWVLADNLAQADWSVTRTGLLVLATGVLVYRPWRAWMS